MGNKHGVTGNATERAITPQGAAGPDKVARYGWTVSDAIGELAYVDKKKINIDEDYQRDAKTVKVLEMASGWSWIACGAIILGKRDGKLWAIDGQHRVLAAMRRSDIKQLPCIIFTTKSQREEARGFYNANALRKPVGAIDKFRALIVAGDETAIYVKGIFEKTKTVLSGGGGNGPGEIKCVALCQKMAAINKAEFEKVFLFVASLCHGKTGIHERLLAGIGYLNNHCGDGLADKRLAGRLIEAGPGRLLDGAGKASGYYSKGGARVWAQGFLDVINRGLQRRYELDPIGAEGPIVIGGDGLAKKKK